MFELVAPDEISIEVGPSDRRRLIKLGRHQGEYWVWVVMEALFRPHVFIHRSTRWLGLESRDFVELFERMPDSILPPSRKKRTYVNGVLARSEVESTYATSRRLWRRESRGVYVPAPGISLAVGDRQADGTETFEPAVRVLGITRTESFLPAGAGRRLSV